jgi:hypothetical protein
MQTQAIQLLPAKSNHAPAKPGDLPHWYRRRYQSQHDAQTCDVRAAILSGPAHFAVVVPSGIQYFFGIPNGLSSFSRAHFNNPE